MIPVAFDYVRPTSVDEAIQALAQHGEDAKLLAGGHSLLPLMKLRLSDPAVLVDLGRVSELRGIREEDAHLVIGAMTTHAEVVDSDLVRQHCDILATTTRQVGDRQVRHRGTFGGAIAHGDAAGDQPTVALALGAEMVVQGPGGRRTIQATDFFVDYLETSLAPDELLVEVRVPKLGQGWGSHYEKFNRVSHAWAIVGVAALVRRENGAIGEARIGLTNMGSTPLRATGAEQALDGAEASPQAIRSACERAADGIDPPGDLNAQPDYRRHLAQVLSGRAVARAAGV